MQNIIEDIYVKTQSESVFRVYLCMDEIHGWKELRYDETWESYRVEYVEQFAGGCLWGEKQSHLDVFLASKPGLSCEILIQNEETEAASQ